jgi:hypothetical protein
MARGNGPLMSSPHTVKGYEGGIICSICADVWICLSWDWHALQVFTSSTVC